MNTQTEVEEYISQITPTDNEAMSMPIRQNNIMVKEWEK